MQLEKLAPRVAAGDRNLGMLFTWISAVLGSQGVLQLDRADREDITRRVTSLNVQLGNFGVAGALCVSFIQPIRRPRGEQAGERGAAGPVPGP